MYNNNYKAPEVLEVTKHQNMYDCAPQKVVSPFNVSAYMGTWYEIADTNTPRSTYESDCLCTTAQYSEINETFISVVNTCFNAKTEEIEVVNGTAQATDLPAAALRVDFGLAHTDDSDSGPNYFLLKLGYDNYTQGEPEYAIVGSPCNSMAWVLSRVPAISTELYREVVDYLNSISYNTSLLSLDLELSNQDPSICSEYWPKATMQWNCHYSYNTAYLYKTGIWLIWLYWIIFIRNTGLGLVYCLPIEFAYVNKFAATIKYK